MAGHVLVADRPLDKAGAQVPVDADLRVRGIRAFASRGGDKLAFALLCFGIEAHGRIALDAGASTGGFTDCLLRHGAARVYAVEVGFGQLLGRLRQDPRVVSMERTNIGDLGAESLRPAPDLVTLDLSYLPLGTAWRTIQPLLAAGTDIVSLVKPLFEVDDGRARRTGIIEGAAPYLDLLARLVDECVSMGWSALGVAASPIRGSRGTVEFLLHARNSPHVGDRPDVHAAVEAAVNPADGATGPAI